MSYISEAWSQIGPITEEDMIKLIFYKSHIKVDP